MSIKFKRFLASFDSDCARCGTRILQDEEYGWVDDEACCEECLEEEEERIAQSGSGSWANGFDQ